jgi:hypothetical protein
VKGKNGRMEGSRELLPATLFYLILANAIGIITFGAIFGERVIRGLFGHFGLYKT